MKHHLYLQIASKLRTKVLRGDYAPEQQINKEISRKREV